MARTLFEHLSPETGPKRVLALRKFASSALYRQHAGLGQDGLSMQEVDNQVFELIRVAR